MRTKANGINFNYTVEGPHAAPWVMFSNSLCTTYAMWDEQAAMLNDKYRVLRYDQRGHGATEAPAGRYAFDTLIADAVALMDAVGVDKAWFGGLSMGGATALGLAQQHPGRVHGIFICDHACKSTPASSQQWEERIVTARQNGMNAMVDSTVSRWFPPEILARNPPYIDKVKAMIRATPLEGYIGCSAALANHDYNCKVEIVTCPVLFIVGEKDGAAPAAMRDMNARLPGSTYVELPGAGHISNLDRPAEFNQALAAFLAG
jgi:3-oxoadipate enol-lactonase